MAEQQRGFWDDAEAVYTYTRQQAIQDGVLVDMDQGAFKDLAREAGYQWPIAMTRAAYEHHVALTPAAKRACNDLIGRYWDILWMMRGPLRNSYGKPECLFQFLCVVKRVRPTLCTLKVVSGPADDGSPCLTIMLPEED